MFDQKPQQIFPPNAIMAAMRARGEQLAGPNPVRHGQMAYGTVPGNHSSREKSLLSLHSSPYTSVQKTGEQL
jgi:hypothetical protein